MAAQIVRRLLEEEVKPSSITVLAPYQGQVSELRKQFRSLKLVSVIQLIVRICPNIVSKGSGRSHGRSIPRRRKRYHHPLAC